MTNLRQLYYIPPAPHQIWSIIDLILNCLGYVVSNTAWQFYRNECSRCLFPSAWFFAKVNCMGSILIHSSCILRTATLTPHTEWQCLTAVCEVCEVDGDVVLFAGQFAVITLQVVSMAGVLRHPLDLMATVCLGRQLRVAPLEKKWGFTVNSTSVPSCGFFQLMLKDLWEIAQTLKKNHATKH